MTFDEVLMACRPHPNGTYDLQPVVYASQGKVEFRWGNSLLPTLGTHTIRLMAVVNKVFENVHPNRIQDLMRLEHCVIVKND
jgi:hypothetical protein